MTAGGDRRVPPARAIVLEPPNLRRTLTIAAVVGTVLFGINQLDVVLAGQATMQTWAKGAITYVVPFVVSNLGVIHGERRTQPLPHGGTDPSPAVDECTSPERI